MLEKGECAMSLILEFVSCVTKNLPELPDDTMKEWIKNPKRLQEALHDVLFSNETVLERFRLLKQIGTVKIKETKHFIVKGHLQEADVGWTGENFQRFFFDKVEENVKKAVLIAHNLEKDSRDASICAELGEQAETLLVHLFALLKRQSRGEKEDILQVNGCANIFYVRGTDSNLWTVHAHWYSGYGDWSVEADSVESSRGWGVGCRVFSRDS